MSKHEFPMSGHEFPWLAAAMLTMESMQVIHLRLAALATGDDNAQREAQLMVSEKVDAAIEAGASMMAGASTASIIDRYRQHVAANVKRLSVA
jgi:uncharacterized lipoprotein NlpE involved in copper resistance